MKAKGGKETSDIQVGRRILLEPEVLVGDRLPGQISWKLMSGAEFEVVRPKLHLEKHPSRGVFQDFTDEPNDQGVGATFLEFGTPGDYVLPR